MSNFSMNKYLKGALKFLGDEAGRLGRVFLPDEWKLVPTDFNTTPQQGNGFDCGVFTIMYADFLTDNLPFTFSQNNMPLFRKKIFANIIRGSLNYKEYKTFNYSIWDQEPRKYLLLGSNCSNVE